MIDEESSWESKHLIQHLYSTYWVYIYNLVCLVVYTTQDNNYSFICYCLTNLSLW